METKAPVSPPPRKNPETQTPKSEIKKKDVLNRLETYLAKRDGVDKVLKIHLYATRFILAAAAVHLGNVTLNLRRLKSFESSVGVARKALRLGQYFKSLNALRKASCSESNLDRIISVVAYGGEGLAYFTEQFVWLMNTGLMDARNARGWQKTSAWASLIGCIGIISLKVRDLRGIDRELLIWRSRMEISMWRSGEEEEEKAMEKQMGERKLMGMVSIAQYTADMMVVSANIREGKGRLTEPILVASAGLFSAVVSAGKTWVTC